MHETNETNKKIKEFWFMVFFPADEQTIVAGTTQDKMPAA
jgi:hypothetical protein